MWHSDIIVFLEKTEKITTKFLWIQMQFNVINIIKEVDLAITP